MRSYKQTVAGVTLISDARYSLLSLASVVLLSGCVTMQGPRGSTEPDSPKPLNVSVSDLTDIFSTQMRELKSLISASKFDEAEKYFLDNSDYFEKRFGGDRPLTSEIKSLSEHVWLNRFESKVNTSLKSLSEIKALPPSSEWTRVNKLLDDADSLASILENHRLLNLASLGQPKALEIKKQRRRVIDISDQQRSSVVLSMAEEVLKSAKHSEAYIKPLKILNADFVNSNEFQGLALAKIKQENSPETSMKEAKRLEAYLSIPSKKEVDAFYAGLVRNMLQSDGVITLDEISTLGKFKTPFRTSEDLLNNVARVGYVDLTSASFKNRNIFDFQIAFKKDVEIDFTPASEATFKSENLSGFDFLFVTDLTAAKVAREFKSKEEVRSRYKSGSRQVPNPHYVSAMSGYQTAMAEFQRAQINSAIPKACQGWGCVLQGLADGMGTAAARSGVEKATQNLANTPQNISIDVFSEYSYQSVEISTTKAATVNYYVIDVKGKKVLRNDFQINDQERFTVAYNVREDDPDSSAISKRFKTESEVADWEKRPVSVPLSSLFGSDGLKSATTEQFKGVQAFLKTLNTRTYASVAPKHTSAATQSSSPVIQSSANSGDTIADERFDSIVIIRNSQAIGTGFYVTPDLILTAYHVVEGGALAELTFYDGTKSYGRVVDHDVRLDLALIRPQTTGKPLKIHIGPLRLGETVEAIGHPRGYEFTITRGVISALRKQRSANIASGNLVEFVQTDTPISPGNSGGPLMLRNEVIGVNDLGRVDKGSQNLNFSVSHNEIRNYLNRFKGQ